ncbi:glycosyltransferase [Brachybacterium sp. YJGR34]|uniref:glycosyltransferase family 4 protein n=1 Tax=Brachybacterium sp. YJGR34 TaxID=2059911 RepID=UPI0018E65A06|nr:glycosyltransferase [Brachybacterium sp. YJGR34]
MQVTIVTTWFPTEVAPARGSFVVRDALAIARHAQVRLIHLVPPADDDGTRRVVHQGIDVLRLPMDPRRPDQVLRVARRLPRALEGADVVHSMAFSALLPLAIRRPRAPWVHTEHWSALTTPETLPAPARRGLPALSRLLALPDRVTAVCEFLARPIREVRGQRPTDIVPCIVDPGELVPRRDRRDGALRLVSTGGLIPRKDPLLAVDVLARLVAEGTDAHLEWLGDGPLREETLRRAADLGVAERLTLPGSVDAEEVRAALGRADLFFGPTRADNFFVSAAEAIVAGRPVVLGSTGGQGEYVQPRIGALVDEQSSEAYTAAILEVDRRTRDLPAQEIADTIGESFSTPAVGAGYARSLQLALSSGPHFPVHPAREPGAEDLGASAAAGDGAPDRPSLLILSFSDISRDARVLKQVRMLSADYRVVTCGYGPTPEGSAQHLQIPSELKQWRLDKSLALTRRFRRTYWEQEVVAWVCAQGLPRTDVVLADDVDTVPLALSLRPRGGVHADLHEYAPRQKEDRLAWRLGVAPYLRWICRTYVTRADSVTTVGHGLAREYEREFGIRAEVVTNAAPYQELSPVPTREALRLVHSGGAMPSRRLDLMIDAMRETDIDATLDLYLVPSDPGYVDRLRAMAEELPAGRVRVHDAVPYDELHAVLNDYDVGIFVCPPTTFNLANALPNKVFDFVQARLALVVSPTPEMRSLVEENQLGAVTAGFAAEDLAETLRGLSPAAVAAAKSSSDRHARALSAEQQSGAWVRAVATLAARA